MINPFKNQAKREEQELLKKYLTVQELNKMSLNSILSVLAPFLFSYIFLALFGGITIYESRAFFYIPFMIIVIFSIRQKNHLKKKNLLIAEERAEKESLIVQ